MLACFSSMPVATSSVVPMIVPEALLVASLSIAANLNRSHDRGIGDIGPLGEVAIATPGTPIMVPIFGEGRIPDDIEDALHDNDDDDDVKPATIADDSDDDIARTTPVVGGGASSSETHQYFPPFPFVFFNFDLDVMAQLGDSGDKKEVVLSVKTYSICRGIEYKVLESDHCKYYDKCKEFGNRCTWLIWISLH
ncbi:hypothetical protein Ahy_A09g045624 [Arachis hypogaea]|uniref:Transposase MuDR plant domain-containing protein n=1 Tax=Arachis hypogaea TaxID=3818 RepID=A0A445BMT0_ARAHY|nr:hypothetical protein Ahy_A09g045624 [Arachis hypogaea]